MENKENLLTCARDLFYARGYDAVGIQEIVDAAGVTKPTMYYYFGSKQGLLEELMRRIVWWIRFCIMRHRMRRNTVLRWLCIIQVKKTKDIWW